MGMMAMTEMHLHLLDWKDFKLDMNANGAKDRYQNDCGNNDAKKNNEIARCLGVFVIQVPALAGDFAILGFARCRLRIDKPDPCEQQKFDDHTRSMTLTNEIRYRTRNWNTYHSQNTNSYVLVR